MNIRQAIAACRSRYLAEGGRESTWDGDYAKVLKHLPQDKPLTATRLSNWIQRWEPNTRSRQRACNAGQYLAKHHDVNWNPGRLRGKYKAKPVDPAKIPEDKLICECFHSLKNRGWRWVYGVIAVYGLRPHEALRSDPGRFLKGDSKFWVAQDTKTGDRRCWALPPEWFYEFSIQRPVKPQIDYSCNNERLGRKASQYFKKTARLPFNLYALRHAWARRAYLEGLDDAAAAKMMGHSLEVHQTIYRAWFDDLICERAYQEMLKNRKPR